MHEVPDDLQFRFIPWTPEHHRPTNRMRFPPSFLQDILIQIWWKRGVEATVVHRMNVRELAASLVGFRRTACQCLIEVKRTSTRNGHEALTNTHPRERRGP